MPRTRILLVTRNLPPLVGGMERLNWHLADELAKVAEVRIVGPDGSAAPAPAGIVVREAPLKPLWKFLLQARALARREARSWQPGIVLAGSGLTAPVARSAARACGARMAVYVHGLDVALHNPVYRALWLPAIRTADRVIANSRATADLCRGIGVDPAHLGIVHPGVDVPGGAISPEREFPSREGSGVADVEPLSLRERGGGEGAPAHDALAPGSSLRSAGTGQSEANARAARSRSGGVSSPTNDDPAKRSTRGVSLPVDAEVLLSVGRLSARKGLREFVTQALPRVAAARPDVVLLIVGDAPNQALHAEAQTPASIQTAADAAGVGRNIHFLGVITDYAELGDVYRAADVHVFPVREIAGDPEGFGMVAVEAAAHGLPTVAFATGGVVDAVAEGQSGHLVPPGDYAAFADAVIHTLAQRDTLHDSCIDFARQFAWPEFGARVAKELSLR